MKGRGLPDKEIKAIFKRFPEGNPYNLPLRLAYEAGLSKEEAFGIEAHNYRVIKDTPYLKVLNTIVYNRKDNQLYFVASENVRYVSIDQNLVEAFQKVQKRTLSLSSIKDTPVYYCGNNGRLNTKGGIVVHPLNLRETDGTFVSPQGINYVARIIHGKEGRIDYVDPEWQWDDLVVTGKSKELWRIKE